ncbi:MAG: uracil-DNA glycosylase [Cohaesibacter sp.]|nr:uracil-DNA glycosylase [Cohaesibacter sp.]
MDLLDELAQCGDWYEALRDQHSRLAELQAFLSEEEKQAQILPVAGQRLAALRMTSLEAVKVVITGQDPYPGLQGDVPHAMGLAFSVVPTIKPPRSLNNIYKELAEGFDFAKPAHGDLRGWAEQGVLMLNSVLSVRQGEAGSHAKKGWEAFSHAVLDLVSQKREPVCFLSWGKHSHALMGDVDEARHMVIRTSHPSPLGARKAGADFEAFSGSSCFQRANDFLTAKGRVAVDWACL